MIMYQTSTGSRTQQSYLVPLRRTQFSWEAADKLMRTLGDSDSNIKTVLQDGNNLPSNPAECTYTFKTLMTCKSKSYSYNMTNTDGIFLQILKSQHLYLTCSLNMFMYLMFKEELHRTNHYAATTWLLLRQNNIVNGPNVDSQCTLHHAWTDEKSCVDHTMEWREFLVSAIDVSMDQRDKDKGQDLRWPTHNVCHERREFWWSPRRTWKYTVEKHSNWWKTTLWAITQYLVTHRCFSKCFKHKNVTVQHNNENTFLPFSFRLLST